METRTCCGVSRNRDALFVRDLFPPPQDVAIFLRSLDRIEGIPLHHAQKAKAAVLTHALDVITLDAFSAEELRVLRSAAERCDMVSPCVNVPAGDASCGCSSRCFDV